MSTVTATVDGATSPYFHSLPDMCKRIPDSAAKQAGFDPDLGHQRLAPTETSSLLQTCGFAVADATGNLLGAGGVGIQAPNVKEFLSQPNFTVVKSNIFIGPHKAYMFTSPDSTPETCDLVYGTFFGSAVFTTLARQPNSIDPCTQVMKIAQILYPYVPTRPSEMSER